MTNNYLNPKRSVGVEPAADRQVENIGACCLDVNGKMAYQMKGRAGMFWLMIWCVIFFPVVLFFSDIYFVLSKGETFTQFLTSLTALLQVTALALVIFLLIAPFPIHVWHNHIPLRFNRNTRKVYLYKKGRIYISDWDNIRAYLKVQDIVIPRRGVSQDPHVDIEFLDEGGKTLTATLRGTLYFSGKTRYEEAAELWEYIRVYMEDGPGKLPAPREYKPDMDLVGLFRDNVPVQLFPCNMWWGIVIALLLVPMRIVFFFVNYSTDIVYFYLRKRIKTMPYPLELEIACCCTEMEQT